MAAAMVVVEEEDEDAVDLVLVRMWIPQNFTRHSGELI
jgi:hypothetical protein